MVASVPEALSLRELLKTPIDPAPRLRLHHSQYLGDDTLRDNRFFTLHTVLIQVRRQSLVRCYVQQCFFRHGTHAGVQLHLFLSSESISCVYDVDTTGVHHLNTIQLTRTLHLSPGDYMFVAKIRVDDKTTLRGDADTFYSSYMDIEVHSG